MINTSAVAWSAAGTENENEDIGVPVQPRHSLCFPSGSLLTLSLSNQNLNSTGVQSYKLGDFSIVWWELRNNALEGLIWHNVLIPYKWKCLPRGHVPYRPPSYFIFSCKTLFLFFPWTKSKENQGKCQIL